MSDEKVEVVEADENKVNKCATVPYIIVYSNRVGLIGYKNQKDKYCSIYPRYNTIPSSDFEVIKRDMLPLILNKTLTFVNVSFKFNATETDIEPGSISFEGVRKIDKNLWQRIAVDTLNMDSLKRLRAFVPEAYMRYVTDAITNFSENLKNRALNTRVEDTIK